MRWFCWVLLASMLSCTTGCSCGGGHSSLAEMKRRALRDTSDDDAPATPKPAAPTPPAPPPPAQTPPVRTPPAPAAVAKVPAPAVTEPAPVAPLPQAELPPVVATPAQSVVEVAEAPMPMSVAAPAPQPAATSNAEFEDPVVSANEAPAETATVDNTTAIASATTIPSARPLPGEPNLRPGPVRAVPAADTRLPIPNKDAQAVSKRLLADLYKDQYDQAKTPDLKKKLAQTLIVKASEISDDVAGHYLQVKLARDLAVQAGDVTLTVQAINSLAATYRYDATSDKVEAFETLAKAIRSQADAKIYFAECKSVLMTCVRADDFTKAVAVLDAAELVAKRGKMAEQLETLEQSRKVLDEMKLAHAVAQPSFSLLEENPDDAAANLAAGRYRCFYRRDWSEGLQNLALSNDVRLRVLAQIDVSHPATSEQQSELADQWYEHSQSISKTWAKNSVQLRAAYWYQLALPGLPNGLVKSRVQKRLSDIASATGDETMKAYVAGKRNVVPLD